MPDSNDLNNTLSKGIPKALVERIRQAFKMTTYTLKPHAFEQMRKRNIHPKEVRALVLEGNPIEYDSPHVRGKDHGILFNGVTSGGRPLHVKVVEETTSSGERHFVITAYEPSPKVFSNDFSIRIKN